MLITDEYRELNADLHSSRRDYGSYGKRWAGEIMGLWTAMLADRGPPVTVLDYGCGKGSLDCQFPFDIAQYDPAVEKYSARPDPADIVVCTDVLEHIEPDCLDMVLDDLKRVTRRVLWVTIATRPAEKKLADGRNAHLIVQPLRWWLPKLHERFDIRTLNNAKGEVVAALEARHG